MAGCCIFVACKWQGRESTRMCTSTRTRTRTSKRHADGKTGNSAKGACATRLPTSWILLSSLRSGASLSLPSTSSRAALRAAAASSLAAAASSSAAADAAASLSCCFHTSPFAFCNSYWHLHARTWGTCIRVLRVHTNSGFRLGAVLHVTHTQVRAHRQSAICQL